MWLQGDIYRRKNPGCSQKGTKCLYPIYSIKQRDLLAIKCADASKSSRKEASFSKIVSKVQNIKIEDEDNGNCSPLAPNKSSCESDEENGNGDKCTQGDKLKQIKAQNQNTPQKCKTLMGRQSNASSPRSQPASPEHKHLQRVTFKTLSLSSIGKARKKFETEEDHKTGKGESFVKRLDLFLILHSILVKSEGSKVKDRLSVKKTTDDNVTVTRSTTSLRSSARKQGTVR